MKNDLPSLIESEIADRPQKGGISKREYSNIHYWLRKNYGNADQCEGEECKGTSKNYGWALLKGKKYEKSRDNFMPLCKSCHTLYDTTDETRRKLSLYQKTKVLDLKPIDCPRCSYRIEHPKHNQKFCSPCGKIVHREGVKRRRVKNIEYYRSYYLKNKEGINKKAAEYYQNVTKPKTKKI